MSTTAGSGRTREPGEVFRKPLLDAQSLDDSGYVLRAEVESSIEKVSIADAAEFPYAVNMRSTTDPFDVAFPPTTFLIGSDDRLPTIDLVDDGEVALKVIDNNGVIAVGDPLVVGAAGGGKVDKYTPTVVGATDTINQAANIIARFTELGKIVGYAQEPVAAGSAMAPGQDKCRTRLTIKMVPTIA
jgi:hypothetical protein